MVDGRWPRSKQAARTYEDGRTQMNAGAKLKRDAEKVLKLIPDGSYGAVTLARVESSREVPDMDAVRELLIRHGHDMPMKVCAPSLTFAWAEQPTECRGGQA